ncbi:MAG: STAS domain-containing protein [bacterium]|nr:STAS domain-containing protein [bacterium]
MPEFQTHMEHDQLIISIAGPRVDISSVSALRKELLQYVDTAADQDRLPDRVIMDLSDLLALDSTGVALLVNLQKKIRESGRRFQLRNVNDTIHKMLQLSNLADYFQIARPSAQ